MAKDPAFLFYPGDWLGGTILFTRLQKGAYIDLLMAQFNSGHLSIDDIKNVLKKDFGLWHEKLSKKFITDENGLFYNEKLQDEIDKRTKHIDHQINNGRKGGRPPKIVSENGSHEETHGFEKPKPKQNPNETHGLTEENSEQKSGVPKTIPLTPTSENRDEKNKTQEINLLDTETKTHGFDLAKPKRNPLENENVFIEEIYSKKLEDSEELRSIAVTNSKSKNKKIEIDFESEELKKTWDEWVRYRTEIRRPMKPTTQKKQICFLKQFSEEDAVQILNESMQNGWQGLFELKKNNVNGYQANHTNNGRTTFTSQVEKNNREFDRMAKDGDRG